MFIASLKGNLECVKLLIEAETEVNQATEVSLGQRNYKKDDTNNNYVIHNDFPKKTSVVIIFVRNFRISMYRVMQLSIFAITIPPRTPGDLHQKFAPPWGFCIQAFAQGRSFVWAAPEGRVFVYKRCFPFLKFSL